MTAPTVDSVGSSGNTWSGGAGPLSWTHTASASSGLNNTVGVVFTGYESVPSAAPTWGGANMTLVGTYSGQGGSFSVYIILNPSYSAGGTTISFSWATGTSYHAGISVLIKDANQSTTPDAVNGNQTGTTTSWAPTVTSTVDNCLGLCFGYEGGGPTVSAGTNTTMLTGNGGDVWGGRSTSAISPAGSFTFNFSQGASQNWFSVALSIAPVPVPGTYRGMFALVAKA